MGLVVIKIKKIAHNQRTQLFKMMNLSSFVLLKSKILPAIWSIIGNTYNLLAQLVSATSAAIFQSTKVAFNVKNLNMTFFYKKPFAFFCTLKLQVKTSCFSSGGPPPEINKTPLKIKGATIFEL